MKGTKTVQQEIPQEKFERILDLLITYKQKNPNKEVSLTHDSIQEAILWWSKNFEGLLSTSSIG